MMSYEQEEMSSNTILKEKLLKLHCPFTWGLSDSVTKYVTINESDEIEDDESCCLEQLIKLLIKCYKAALSAEDVDAAAKMEKAEGLLILIQQEQELHRTIRAIEHVFYATKCFLLYEAEKTNELEEILENIIDIDFSIAEQGALYGCESIVWSCLKDFGMNKAVDTAKKAIHMDQDCALWHFILAKNLRRQRRTISLSSEVSDMEEQHFELAYGICDNPVFGIYYLQMRFEKFHAFVKSKDYVMKKNANEKEVLQIAKQMLKKKPTNYKVLLKLARMFLRANISDETLFAKECLDEVEKIAPSNTTHLHYTGMLYEECGDFKDALKYYKKAADSNNFVAELNYVRYGWETGELEPLPHILQMLKKYKGSIKERQITMLLAIAIIYYSIHKDIPNAAEYFLKALTTDPLNKKFKVFYKFLDFQTQNISNFLSDHFLPETTSYCANNPMLDQTCRKIKKLLNRNNISDLTEEFGSMSMYFEEEHKHENLNTNNNPYQE